MACFSADCPHCGTAKASFQILSARAWPANTFVREKRKNKENATYEVIVGKISAGGMCPECNNPVGAVFAFEKSAGHFNIDSVIATFPNDQRAISAHGLTVENVWPPMPEPKIPNHLPPASHRAFDQAEQNFARRNIESAIAMYGVALEKGLKAAFPDVPGMLNEKVNRLVRDKILPTAIGEWAGAVRFLRNDAAHDLTEMSEADMIAARNFTDAVLRYSITLPAEVEARRNLPPEQGGDPHPADGGPGNVT